MCKLNYINNSLHKIYLLQQIWNRSERRLTQVISWTEPTRRPAIPGQSHLENITAASVAKNICGSETETLTSPEHLKCFLSRFDFDLHTAGNVHVVVLILSKDFRLRRSVAVIKKKLDKLFLCRCCEEEQFFMQHIKSMEHKVQVGIGKVSDTNNDRAARSMSL